MIYEFTTYVQFEAEDEDEAQRYLAAFLATPDLYCYAIGVGDMTPRVVVEEGAA